MRCLQWGVVLGMFVAPSLLRAESPARAAAHSMNIPNQEVRITPLSVPGSKFQSLNPGLKDFPKYTVGSAVTTAVSPDGKTLLVLTSGYNVLFSSTGKRLPKASTQFVFVFDIAHGAPVRKQAIAVPNTYCGIVFDPDGKTFYVSGGVDDNVHIFDLGSDGWAERAGSPVALGHGRKGIGINVKPQAAGIAITSNGGQIVIANYGNDSISVLTKAPENVWEKTGELDLRPGKINPADHGVPGGEYPFWVVIKGDHTAYVSSLRDREIDVVALGQEPKLTARIRLRGQPNKMCLNSDGSRLYVAQDESDSIAVIDTAKNQLVNNIFAGGPAEFSLFSSQETGNNTNDVTLSRDGKYLYVTNGTANDVAVISLEDDKVIGLIPTGLYPDSVS
ncbi:MAG: YncE family protein, partial [Bryobacteraceae bacterium]